MNAICFQGFKQVIIQFIKSRLIQWSYTLTKREKYFKQIDYRIGTIKCLIKAHTLTTTREEQFLMKMNKKLDSRRATSNNNPGLSVGNQNTSSFVNQSQSINQQAVNADRNGGSPAQSLNNIQKISARLRARNNNPVVMSMNTSPQMLLPLSQRSLSPTSYQQLQTQQTDARGNIVSHPNSMPTQPIQGLKQPQKMGGQVGASTSHSPQANQPSSRDFTHQRKILHKSLNSGGVQKGPTSSIDAQKEAGSMLNQRHNGSKSQSNNAAVHANGDNSRTHHPALNMSNHMISARQQPGDVGIIGMSSERGPLSSSNQQDGGIHLNKKFSANRKRNAREKSYDLYNQKLQLPPMQKPGQDGMSISQNAGTNRVNNVVKPERTYSLPSASHVHQSMPLSPNLAMQSITSPKNGNHPVNQRQSINDALKSQVQSLQSNGGQSGSVQSRFGYNSGGQMQAHQKIYSGHKGVSQSSTIQQPSSTTNANMKGFFSARGQGIRGGANDSFDKSAVQQTSASHDLTGKVGPNAMNHHGQRGNQMVNSQNGPQIQGMFSPRRNIMSGSNNNGPGFVGMRQQQQSHSRQTSSKMKKNQQVQSLNINTNLNTQFQHSDKGGKQPSSASHQDEMRIRQSLTLSPKMQHQNQTPQPQQVRDHSHHHHGQNLSGPNSQDAERHDHVSVDTRAETAADSDKNGDAGQQRGASRLSGASSQDQNIHFVEVQTLLFGENPPVLNPKTLFLKNHEPTKASQKKCGLIKSYAANTNQGIIRDYNEDRVSIILNILKPKTKQNLNIEWPQICFFGVFDGHGGAACADYLRDNLHNYVVQNENFPQFPQEAIVQGFKECERSFINLVELAQTRAQNAMPGQQVGPERSGSCATVVMIIDDMAYVINVGDSRCIMSIDSGAQIASCSRDHKPDDEQERIRIQAAGGKIYRTQTFAKAATSPEEKDLYVQGPLRAFPGRLSVSRTFGDIEAKKQKYGGNPNVIVCDPEIRSFKLKNNFDFFMIGCDGIFERLGNKDCIDAIWNRIDQQITSKTPDNLSPAMPNNRGGKGKISGSRNQSQFHYDEHIAAAEGVEIVLREAAASRSLDNITVLILGLKNLKQTIKKMNEGKTLQQVRAQNMSDARGIQHTYDRDFEHLEVNEQDLNMLSDNDVNSANDSLEADVTCIVEEEKNKKNSKSVASPQRVATKAPPSRQKQSTSVGAIHRKF